MPSLCIRNPRRRDNDFALPQPLARVLHSIAVQVKKHDSTQDSLLQSLVDSAVQRHSNRTAQCPIFLAEELNRCTFQPQYVKAFVKLYQQRIAVSPGLSAVGDIGELCKCHSTVIIVKPSRPAVGGIALSQPLAGSHYHCKVANTWLH